MTTSNPQMQGPMYSTVYGVDNEREMGTYIQQYIDKNGKPPTIIIVNPKAPEVKLPERFVGLDITILRKSYVHHPMLVWLGKLV